MYAKIGQEVRWGFTKIMKLFETSLKDALEISPTVNSDHMGYSFESFNQIAFNAALGYESLFVQDNVMFVRRNVLRGLHYQAGHAQGKLVGVIQGAIFDVAVDLRKPSPTFHQWLGIVLSSEKKNQLWMPPGFAHGFLALTDSTVYYKVTDYHCSDCECVLRWDDENLAIHWPLERAPIVIGKDTQGRSLKDLPVFE